MEPITNIEDRKTSLKYDGQISISTGKSRFEKKWKNKTTLWSAFIKKLEVPVRTPETYAEFRKMSKADQDKIKDVGGYVGGTLTDGRRSANTVAGRQLLTLDLDFAPLDYFDYLELMGEYAACSYTTHKHSKESPRFRLLIPLDRVVSPDEYEAIARKIAEDIGIDYFDDTTYQPSRLMYYPSVSADGEYLYGFIDAPFLCADDVLARYPDWKDVSYWAESSRATGIKKKMAEKQGNPVEKKGVIGAFCRAYTVPEAIEVFLPHVYTECTMPDRYTYTGGSTAAGLVIYEDGAFAYSNHGTDPASGKLCNAFDLVRIHLFGELDAEVAGDTVHTKLPSYKSMISMAIEDSRTKAQLTEDNLSSAKEDFTDDLGELQYGESGALLNTISNIVILLKHDDALKNVYKNDMSGAIEFDEPLPWTDRIGEWKDADDAQVQRYLERNGKFSKQKVMDAVTILADDRRRHPVRDYLDSLPQWDGIKRVDTLLVDWLGAEDCEYTRAVTRKTLCGAIYRVLTPGCKHDTVLVLNGDTGIGKSTLIAKLGGKWFSDSLSLADTKDKTAAEKLQGFWIMEIPELSGMRKTDVETLKAFISRQYDDFRAAYGRRSGRHYRQCIFIGSTNAGEDGYLRDITGNRRFWDVPVHGGTSLHPWDMTQETVDQIWAEVKLYCEERENVTLNGTVAEAAVQRQLAAMESDPREGMVREYLNTLVPGEWYTWGLARRRGFIQGSDFEDAEGTMLRDEISNQEIWCECFGKKLDEMMPKDSYALSAIMEKIGGWRRCKKAKRIPLYGLQRIYERANR